MSTLTTLMRDIVAGYAGDLNPLVLVKETIARHPVEWEEYEEERALKGGRAMAAAVLRETLASAQEPLPGLGMALPPRITLPDGEGGFIHRRFDDCTLLGKDSDLRVYETVVLQQNIDAATEAQDSARQRREAIENLARRYKVTKGSDLIEAMRPKSSDSLHDEDNGS